MTEQLPSDVRDRAAQAAYTSTAISPYPGWADLKEEWREQQRREVDAVTAVVAPEIARPLQARIAELEAAVAKQEIAFQGRALLEEMWRKEKVVLQARIEELEAANAAVEEENDLLRDVIQQKHARIEVLTAALTDALEGMEDMRPYVSQYFAEKWGHDGYITRARAALAAGATESEAP